MKTTQLPTATSVAATDALAVVIDPGTTPISKQITTQNLADSLVPLRPASETQAGAIELANTAEMLAGVDALRAITPALVMNAFQIKRVEVTEHSGPPTHEVGDAPYRVPVVDASIVWVEVLDSPDPEGNQYIALPPAKVGQILIINKTQLHTTYDKGHAIESDGEGGSIYEYLWGGYSEGYLSPSTHIAILFGFNWDDGETTMPAWGGLSMNLDESYPLRWPYANDE